MFARETQFPRLNLGWVEQGGAHAGLEDDGVDVDLLVIVEDADEFGFLTLAIFLVGGKRARPVKTLDGGEPDGSVTLVETDAAWISGEGDDTDEFGNVKAHVLEGLKTNTYYIFREINAPAGYNKITTDVVFHLDEQGRVVIDKAAQGSSAFGKDALGRNYGSRSRLPGIAFAEPVNGR